MLDLNPVPADDLAQLNMTQLKSTNPVWASTLLDPV